MCAAMRGLQHTSIQGLFFAELIEPDDLAAIGGGIGFGLRLGGLVSIGDGVRPRGHRSR